LFSKTYDDEFNPQAEFAAILTCSSADGACPFIAGAEKELPSPLKILRLYNPQQAEKYHEEHADRY
jgi:arsenate reductase